MANIAHNERRKYPRIKDEKISLKVKSEQFDTTISQSLNISASGVYCKVDKQIPLMSRVKIILMLPSDIKGGKMKKVDTDGVVVREHPVTENGKILHYDVAVFFDNLSAKDRETIKDYIARRIPA